jgi:hypothetical protein
MLGSLQPISKTLSGLLMATACRTLQRVAAAIVLRPPSELSFRQSILCA